MGVSGNHGAIANVDPGHERRTTADPNIVADHNITVTGWMPNYAFSPKTVFENMTEWEGGYPIYAMVSAQVHGNIIGNCKTRSNIGPQKRLRFAVVAE